MNNLKKITIIWSLLSLVLTAYAQPTQEQNQLLKVYRQKFELVKNALFPDNDHYIHKDMHDAFFGPEMAEKSGIYPAIYNHDNLKMKSVYFDAGWSFHINTDLKIGDEVISFSADNEDCTLHTSSGKADNSNKNHFDTSQLKTIDESQEVKIRKYGDEAYDDVKINPQIWKDTYIFYRLLKACGEL